jgi:hypothetical protein
MLDVITDAREQFLSFLWRRNPNRFEIAASEPDVGVHALFVPVDWTLWAETQPAVRAALLASLRDTGPSDSLCRLAFGPAPCLIEESDCEEPANE